MKNLLKVLFLTIGITCITTPIFSQPLNGTYTIGSGGNYTSVSAAMSALLSNGVSGNVIFSINNGSYTGVTIDFSSGITGQGTYDTITFTSTSNNPSNVTITSSGTSVLVNNAKNLVIKNLTIGSTTGTKGVEITGTCDNIEIKNCNIKANLSGYSSNEAGIFLNSSSSVANNLRILNNNIDGGYYGIYLFGYSYNNYNTNFLINGNTLSNAYQYGVYLYYISLNSFSNNIITSRSSNYSASFYGASMTYTNAAFISGNKVQALTTAITYPYGMIFQYVNYRNTTSPSLISNNEIFVFTNSSYYGMYVTYSRANIYNNSILVGGSGAARALYVDLIAGTPVNIRNNNLHAIASNAYPIYIPSSSVNFFGNILKMDYNNYYNQTNIGYAGGDVTTMANWQFLTGQDAHSISIYPNYTDLFSYKLITDGEDMICPRISSVTKDIRDTLRKAITSMGAYHTFTPKVYDTKILNLISPPKDVTVGVTTPVRVSIMNMGSTPIDSINIHWSVNGTTQTYLWTGSPLALGDSTSILTLGNFTPLAGDNEIIVYTNLLSGKIDNKPENDTVKINSFGCKTTINSVYTVGGSSADFATITEAIDVIKYCGVSTPTTISINAGTYNENIIIPTIKGTNSTNTLTITSASGDSSSVIIQSTSSTPTFTLSNTNNLIIKKLTIKGVNSGTSSTAIKLQNSNKNILITNNYITVSTNNPSTTTSTNIMAIISQTSLDTNLTISNNYINGSGGIYISSSSTSSCTYNVDILNNKLDNIFYYGIYTSYTRIAKITSNKIYQNAMAAIWGGGSGYGLYVYYSYGVNSCLTDISNNLIRGAFGNFANFNSCYSDNGTNTNVLFTNNALIKTGAGPVTYMLYINSGQWQCINNTFVNIGTGTVTNMARIEGTSTNMNVSNNLFTSLTGIANYLMYWNVTGTYILDYNDYYTVNGNIAYHGNNYASLSAWKSAYPSYNLHSKNEHPRYIDSLNNVKPTNWVPLMCTRNSYVTSDILGNPRAEATYMGCYEAMFSNDAGLISFISPTLTSTAGDTTKIIVKLINYGTTTLNSITINYKVNGVLYAPVVFTNLGLTKHKDTNLVIGFFIPILNNTTSLVVWCQNPNSTTDANTYNDTILTSSTGCAMVLNGYYTIGNSLADFTTVANAISALKSCGVSGPVVFKLLSGTYPSILIDTTFSGVNSTNTITFTSSAGNADSVIIQSNATALTLKKTHNLNFTKLTFDVQSGSVGVDFTDTCSNILIKNCKIKMSTSTTSSTVTGINKSSNTFSINNLSIIKNTINGGYTSINLNGASTLTAMGNNIRIDSNTMSNAYRYGLNALDYIHFTSLSYNTITTRTSNAGSYFDAIRLYTYTEADTINNNKINATKNSTTTYANGIYCYTVNYYSSTSATVQIANNEIILQGYYDGITAYYTRSQILHNSIYITGNGGSDGMYIYTTSTIPVTIMNNNSVNLSSSNSATAIYMGSTVLTSITADCNNYYTMQGTPCQFGSPFYNLSSWQSATGLDMNSSSILPTYINTSIDLRIDGSQLLCRKLASVPYDLYGINRKKLTNKGSYHTYIPLAYDIMPLSIISPTEDVSNFISIPVRITIFNRGDTSISTLDINWSVNGINQSVYHWSGTPIEMGDSSAPILIDYYTPAMGFNTFKFYTSSPNGHTDGFPSNDTISIISFACGSELSGIYTIGGSSADFPDINTALKVLSSCGVNGDVTFKINSGSYSENISILSPVMDANANYKIVFTSTANNADSVIIISNTTAITLANLRNVSFKHLTLNVVSGTMGVEFSNTCSNIEISNCKIKMNPTSTLSSNIGIYKADNTGTLDTITIKNNLIDGGYYGIYLYGGQYISSYILGSNLIIDSNTITNSYLCGMYYYYADFQSIGYNNISSRSSSPYSTYYGIRIAYSNANILGNRIYNPSAISNVYGIYLYYYFNYFTTLPGIVANNEIITYTNNYSYGIFSNGYIRTNIINNSIYSKGGSYCRGIYINSLTSGYNVVVKNNNVVNPSYGYPIYLAANSSVLTMDYNNYYAPTYIGYYSNSYTTLSSWKSAVVKDLNSVSVNPAFINTNVNLELTHGTGLNCPRDNDVQIDIKKKSRRSTTTMGAYEPKFELALTKITKPVNGSKLCSQETSPIDLVVSNTKATSINFASDSMVVHIRISGAMIYQKDTTIKTGTILGLQSDTITIANNFQFLDSGAYNILVYINNIDEILTNDTIQSGFHVNISYQHKDTITLCANELPLTYGDSIFKVGTLSGNYPVHYTLSTGCDSLITLTLKVNPSYHHYDTLTVCDNELPRSYGDSIIPFGAASGTRYIHFTLLTGCDSLIQLYLKVNPTYNRKDTVTICTNDLPYKYGDSTFKVGTISGNYPVHFTLKTGCDSLITLTLRVNPSYSHKDTVTICANELPYSYGDSTFKVGTVSGNYPVHYTLKTGCDSLITLTLKVNPTYHHYDTLTVCDNELPRSYGDSIIPFGAASGTRYIHFTLPTGCDSLIQLYLKVNPTYNHKDTVTICTNDLPYKYGDSTFKVGTVSGNYPIHFTLKTGCDSLITLTLRVNPSYSHKDTVTICANELPYSYGDSTFKVGTVSGNYPVHYTLKTGCDSLITLTLKVNPTYHHYDTLTVCDNELPRSYGDSMIPFGAASGTRYIHFTLPTGCDSLIQLYLKVNPTYNHKDTVTICTNDLPYKYGDSTFKVGTVSGNYPVHFTLKTGCDSLITLTLRINPSYSHKDTVTICTNELPYSYGDSTFKIGTVSGNYPVHFTLKTGCDSLITLTLKVNPTYHHYDTLTVCDNDLPRTYGDSIIPFGSTSGTRFIHFNLPTGCDSLIQLYVKVNRSYAIFDTLTICETMLPISYADTTFSTGTSSGNYMFIYILPTGCDSVVHLKLTINPVYNHTDTITVCINDFPIYYGDSIFPIGTMSGTYPVHFTLPTTCDSLIMLTININPTYLHYDTLTVCNGDLPYTYGDSILNSAGNYVVHFAAFTGCDSIVNLKLNVFNCQGTDIVDICTSDLPYHYGDSTLYSSGIYQVVFHGYSGLDSIIALTLRVHGTYNLHDTLHICNNDFPFNFGDSIITSTGNYIIPFYSVFGCDSIINLTVYALPNYNIYDTISICENQLPYTYSDSVYYSSGNYDLYVLSTQGCDSNIHLTLFVFPSYNNYDTATICSYELPYKYGDSIFDIGTLNGTYPIHFTLPSGCDSLINLTLTINNAYSGTDTISLCNSELPFQYGDSIYNAGTLSGTYPVYYTLSSGCDSLINLTLLINPDYTQFDTVSICNSELPLIYGDSIFKMGTTSGDYTIIFTLPTGCDSIIHLNLNVYPTFNHSDSIALKDIDFPFQYGDSIFPFGTSSGIYPIAFSSEHGCDSIIHLTLNVIPTYFHTDTVTICNNELPYSYGNQTLKSSGTYVIKLISSQGTDSVIVLTLYVNITYSQTVYRPICDQDLPYHFANDTFDIGGTYYIHLNTINGCDSLITFYLVVKSIPTQPDTIFGLNQINQIGQYIYNITPIENATSYNWSISNIEWMGHSKTNIISVFIPTPSSGTISVKAVNECGESEATELSVTSSIGIKEAVVQPSVEIFPNPANNFFYLKTSDINGKTSIQITDVSGKTIYYEEINVIENEQVFKFNTSTYSKGFYYISIHNNSNTIIKKLIVD